MKAYLLDVWGLDSERYLVTRSHANFNMFCLTSLGTGEVLTMGTGRHLYEFLGGKNKLNAAYNHIANYRQPGYVKVLVPNEDWSGE